jgi:hypothetical protein
MILSSRKATALQFVLTHFDCLLLHVFGLRRGSCVSGPGRQKGRGVVSAVGYTMSALLIWAAGA